jgi:predicted DNA-binding protein with PD1-like motif
MKILKRIQVDRMVGCWNLLSDLWQRKWVTTVVLLVVTNLYGYAQQDSILRYVKVPAGYMMVLRQGDDVFAELEKLAREQQLLSAGFTGMGFVNVRFGYFDFAKKKYKPKQFNKVELTGMHGSIAWNDTGNVSIHAHGTVAGKNFKAYAGHILAATVSTGSVEILVIVHDKKLLRVKDEKTGANVLQLKE